MLNFSFQRQQDAGILLFSGEITSQYNDDFKSALMMSISNSDKVVINFDDVSTFDRICLQTLCTAVKMAKRLKKNLIFNIGALKEKARHNGISCSILGCDMCNKEGCLLCQSWVLGAMA